MEIIKHKVADAYAIRIHAEEAGNEVGRVYVYLLYNDLHDHPFGLIEDLHVDETYRGQGLGSQLLSEAIQAAKNEGCYKLLCTSRHGREQLHGWYEKNGFDNYGVEFRMNFDTQ